MKPIKHIKRELDANEPVFAHQADLSPILKMTIFSEFQTRVE